GGSGGEGAGHPAGIEGGADRIGGELGPSHVLGGLVGGGEVVDLELHQVAVGVAVVQRRGDAVLDGHEGLDAARHQLAVPFEQRGERGEAVGGVLHADRLGRPLGEAAGGGEGDAVVFLVVGEEAEHLVLKDDAGAEDGAVPVLHLGQAVGL